MKIKTLSAVSFASLLIGVGCSGNLTSTRPDNTESRDLSKYARNEIPQENIYRSPNTYEVAPLSATRGKKAKNVVLMIGDGMGLVHTYTAWTANKGKLNLAQMPYTGLTKTYCANKLVTDSGAAGTALATGEKTNYHSVGVDTAGNDLASLTDYAQQAGKKTGVVVTCRLNDATPAAFCANHVERDSTENLVADYLQCNVDYLFGGGRKHFEKRTDGRNIIREMEEKGYTYVADEASLFANPELPVLALLDTLDLPSALKRGDIFQRVSVDALNRLKNNQGFFVMLEGSQIDDFGHFNEVGNLVEEIFDFDKAVGNVLEWAARDGETLVVVTSDHETGGLSLVNGDLEQGEVQVWFTTKGHSGVMVPVYAYGPGAENFTGVMENTEVSKKIRAILED